MQRVPPEERGHKGASPGGPRHPLQGQKQQHGAGRMQQHARQVMAPRVQPVKLAVGQNREPCQRVPETSLQVAKSPLDALPVQPALDVSVLVHVNTVIAVDEVVARCRPEDGHRHGGQQEADQSGQGAQCPARPAHFSGIGVQAGAQPGLARALVP